MNVIDKINNNTAYIILSEISTLVFWFLVIINMPRFIKLTTQRIVHMNPKAICIILIYILCGFVLPCFSIVMAYLNFTGLLFWIVFAVSVFFLFSFAGLIYLIIKMRNIVNRP